MFSMPLYLGTFEKHCGGGGGGLWSDLLGIGTAKALHTGTGV